MTMFEFMDAYDNFINTLYGDVEKSKETKKFKCSCDKNQDEQHFCKDCKWCDCKNETVLLCKHKKWNPSGESTIVRGNDFCSYWEKKEVKTTLTKEEVSLLRYMKEIGFNGMLLVKKRESNGVNTDWVGIYFYKNSERDMIEMNVSEYNKMIMFKSLKLDEHYEIDELLKG